MQNFAYLEAVSSKLNVFNVSYIMEQIHTINSEKILSWHNDD